MNKFLIAYLFFLPGGVANMAPVLANRVPWLNSWKTPLDFGQKYKGKRIFGPNKTWRGLFSGIALAGFVAYVEAATIYQASPKYVVLVTLLGMLMGFGALAGDAIESFFKRQHGVPSGNSWFPFDQLDYIFGGLIVVMPFLKWDSGLVLIIIAEYFGLHLITSYIAFKLGLKSKPI